MKKFASKKGTLSIFDMKKLPLLWGRRAIVLSLTVLTGCTSLTNIGESEYSCPGTPSGVSCMSTRDVYNETNDGHVPRPMHPDQQKQDQAASGSYGSDLSNAQIARQQEQQFINNYVAPYLPDKPVPIRTPAEVMRIWIAPWEDQSGDLIATGYVFTEIEARRWVVGEEPAPASPTLRPLQVKSTN